MLRYKRTKKIKLLIKIKEYNLPPCVIELMQKDGEIVI